ncbi:MAG: hypothetical protein H6735_34155 [Alphaproteobacteria bacterium]|nr:hypothetical protein [Alphaproteobacteria bacterium]
MLVRPGATPDLRAGRPPRLDRDTTSPETFLVLGHQLLHRVGNTELELWLLAASASSVRLWEVLGEVCRADAPSTWLRTFREYGFDPNAAALALVEAGLSTSSIGVAMAAAGYTDGEILDGLRACGRGVDPTTRALADAGWSPERLAAMLRDTGALEPEVREILRAVVGRGA